MLMPTLFTLFDEGRLFRFASCGFAAFVEMTIEKTGTGAGGTAALCKARGFSLIELMVAVVIFAVLVAAATPVYQKHTRHLRQLDGQTRLLEIMDLEHRHFARALTYSDDFGELGLAGEDAAISARGHYRLSAAACDGDIAECVRLTATPARSDDAALTLDSRGRRTPVGVWR